MKRRSHALGFGPAVLAALAFGAAATAHANPEAACEISGRVSDRQGRAIEGADVIVTRPDGAARVVAISDEGGRFALATDELGPARVVIVTARGARVASALVTIVPAGRIAITAEESGPERDLQLEMTATVQAPIYAPTADLSALVLSRQRDLEGALLTLPGSGPAIPPAAGASLWGRATAEIPMRFEGFDLHDPLDGRLPLALPLTLFGSLSVANQEIAGIELRAPEVRARHAGFVEGAVAVASAARGADGIATPDGLSAGYAAALGASVDRGGWRAVLRVAPQQGSFEIDPGSATAPRGQRRRSIPALLWARRELGPWRLAGGGIIARARTERGRSERILPPSAPHTDSELFTWVGAQASLPLAAGRNQITLRSAFLRSGRTGERAAVVATESTARRFDVAAELRLAGRWGVPHEVRLASGIAVAEATRLSAEPTRQGGLPASDAEARVVRPFVSLEERVFLPGHLSLTLGAQLAGAYYRGASTLAGESPLERSFSTEWLLAPNARLEFRPGTGVLLFAAAARQGAPLLLEPLLGAAAGPRIKLPTPAEEAAAVGVQLHARRFAVGLTARAQRSIGIIEDRFSPGVGRLELWAPLDAQRTRASVAADATVDLNRFRIGAALELSRLQGNHTGFVDEATGELRPASTGAFDGAEVEVNRRGQLPLDRPLSARAFAEGTIFTWGKQTLTGVARARVDAGTPRAATASSASSGEGQIFLAERGSLGRLKPVASLDVGLALGGQLAGRPIRIELAAFNLTQHRPVIARDGRWSGEVLTPSPGAGPEAIAAARNRNGSPGAQDERWGRIVAAAEPLLVRLSLRVDY